VRGGALGEGEGGIDGAYNGASNGASKTEDPWGTPEEEEGTRTHRASPPLLFFK
jgi:hypothetical protein